MEQHIEIERLAAFIPHQHLCLERGLAEYYRVDQTEVAGPLLPCVDGEVLGAEAEVDLNAGFGFSGFAEEFPLQDYEYRLRMERGRGYFGDPSEAVLRKGGGRTFGRFAEYLIKFSYGCCNRDSRVCWTGLTGKTKGIPPRTKT
jgi:hypothetical protein